MPDNSPAPKSKPAGPGLRIIDQTIREGMQYQGLVFTLEQRLKMLAFQEQLGIDICQAGYPSAHPKEARMVKQMADHARSRGWRIRVAALGRAFLPDAEIMLKTGIRDFHFHLHVKNRTEEPELKRMLEAVSHLAAHVRDRQPRAVISLAMLDLGRTDPHLLQACIRFLSREARLDILSLPDTSGIMAPNQVAEKIRAAVSLAGNTAISVHCHNDMGMASANTLMGVLAGASLMEVSALGLGERNGIADLFPTARLLRDQGIDMGFDPDDKMPADAYARFVNGIVREQTGRDLIQPNTPVFGEGCATHVAGTHADGRFGTAAQERYFLNPLCGRRLVEKYLAANEIPFDPRALDRITAAVKDRSFALGRRLTPSEVRGLAGTA